MMLTRLQRLRFFKLFDPLISYANERLGVVDELDLSPADGVRNGDAQAAVARELWGEHPDTVLAYVDENPDGLTPGELEDIETWCQGLTGEFIALRFPDGVVRLVHETGVYETCGVVRDLSDVVNASPCAVGLTLLPFGGRIVVAGYVDTLPVHIKRSTAVQLAEAAAEIMYDGMVKRTARELRVEGTNRRIEENEREIERIEAQIEEIQASIERMTQRADGK